ncbi:NADH-quinone oxidoreductase subunit N [Austwickia sp. TVS 96-490-7B]|uniref:NADH-quinone oxidoreductase subunit NuoN n=1 Tax=Austwickia sp. TVS 96-490-7B TaxID=2830843 RepID=UPI001C562387|nr:NADH-quinone oxidoreductase subunit NuoN [Austwickia sp. TVS 96-490-7B]MBW3085677.1 NADH-quinone oxidoreductase subunit N [Austwickia sp. TVS 96-490-7B]
MIPVLAAAEPFSKIDIDYAAISPMLVVFGGALVSVLVEAFVGRRERHEVQLGISVVSLVGAFVALVTLSRHHMVSTMAGAAVIDQVSVFLQGLLLVLSCISIMIMGERLSSGSADAFAPSASSIPGSKQEELAERVGAVTTEVFPLALFATGGMMMFVAAGDLLAMFVALEVLSLPLYVMTAVARRRRLLSQEAALKYFLLGSFSSAFFLFGAALLYGFAGSISLGVIAQAIFSSINPGLLVPGVVFTLFGVLFKIGAWPFHNWVPDVYQGAPTPITGFMAACTKIAAFGALLRLVYVGVSGSRWDWLIMLWVVAAVTMIVGAVLTVTQTDIKRLLAYSSVAHAGFILVGFLAFDQSAVRGVMFYLAAYGFTTVAAFGMAFLVRVEGMEATSVQQWEGLGRRHPMFAGVFFVLLLGFAGIPLTSGFTAKLAAFLPAVKYGGPAGVVLVVIGVLCSLVTAYAYFRIASAMFRSDDSVPDSEGAAVAEVLVPSSTTVFAIAMGVIVTVALGVFPSPLLQIFGTTTQFLP